MAVEGLVEVTIRLAQTPDGMIRGHVTGTDAQGRTAILARDWPAVDFPAAVSDLAPVIVEMEYEAQYREVTDDAD